MSLIQYHKAQREIQREASTDELADKLVSWVGPVVRYAELADLIVTAQRGTDSKIQFIAISGKPPLIHACENEGTIFLQFPREFGNHIDSGTSIGGLVIMPSEGRRSRFQGILSKKEQHLEIECDTAFTNCKKYIAPSMSLGENLKFGPSRREKIDFGDDKIPQILSRAVTSFLGTITPDEMPDVSHRGGEPGFLNYDVSRRRIEWIEYLGDGMFVSMGNVRATGRFTLLVPDLESGGGLEIFGSGNYENIRTTRKQRVDGLIQAKERYPVQGRMLGTVEEVFHLDQICHPRVLVEN
jgi:hypothetical protein